MRRIIPLELVGLNRVPYDIFNDKGEVISRKGEYITPNLVMKLNFMRVYKGDDNTLSSVALIETRKSGGICWTDKLKPALSKMNTEYLIEITKEIWKKLEKDNFSLDIAKCHEVTNVITGETNKNYKSIKCISQLRLMDDEYQVLHAINVSILSTAIGMCLNLNEDTLKALTLGAFLHDVGKVKIPKKLLIKTDSLTSEDFEIIKKHPEFGYEIIKQAKLPERITKMALEHHERYGGDGYPNKLKGNEISLFGQIIAIADVYDELVSKRQHRPANTHSDALEIMISAGIDSFNPDLLLKFLSLSLKPVR